MLLESIIAALVVAISIVSYIIIYGFRSRNKQQKKQENVNGSDGLSTQYKTLKLIDKTQYNQNTIIFKFALPLKTDKMGLSIGSHVMLKYKTDDNEFGVARPYTPITNDFDESNRGYFELMIKIYANGRMTQYLNALNVGDTMQIKKYKGKLNYKSNGHFTIAGIGDIHNIDKIGMIAGGSGLTPLLQLIRYVIHCKNNIEINLIFANKTINDILLKDELQTIHNDNNNKINVFFTVSRINEKDKQKWNGGIGRINVDMIRKHTFEPANNVLMLLCGPKPMTQSAISYLYEIGHQKDRIFIY